jgi:F420-non-reducing hydrogenase small subunit
VGMGCRGCYGPNEGVVDHGAKLLTGIASVLDAQTPEEVDAILDTLPDPAGYFYRFHLPDSLLRRRARSNGEKIIARVSEVAGERV